MLLPPKSLRSRLGDSERFNPLQREGDRFTAEGERGEGGKARREGWGGRRGEQKEGERERGVVYRGLAVCLGDGNTGWQTGPSPLPSEPRKMPGCSIYEEQMPKALWPHSAQVPAPHDL